ncbi:hypothetical protein ACHAWO_006578 [Cyclotella atomus]|uniref:Uncharacterized protein n=1 Tax=Cyclotella atomus TaxID=382360 RepID=A0ABD3NK04_9STRA
MSPIFSSWTGKKVDHFCRYLQSLHSSAFAGVETDVPHPLTPEKTIFLGSEGGPGDEKCGEEGKKLFHLDISSERATKRSLIDSISFVSKPFQTIPTYSWSDFVLSIKKPGTLDFPILFQQTLSS